MKPAPSCPTCDRPAVLVERHRRVRRGGREVEFNGIAWECPSGDLDPDGSGVFAFTDATAAAANHERLDAAWRLRYDGEPLPDPRRPGPPLKQEERLQVRFSSALTAKLDRLAAFGDRTRSSVLRDLVERAAQSVAVRPEHVLWAQGYQERSPERRMSPLLGQESR
jgi:hypothetical protein